MNIVFQDPAGDIGQHKDVEKGTAVSVPHSRSRRKRRNNVKEVSLDMWAVLYFYRPRT